MMTDRVSNSWRCPKCNALQAELYLTPGSGSWIKIRCHKCKNFNFYEAAKLPTMGTPINIADQNWSPATLTKLSDQVINTPEGSFGPVEMIRR